MPRLSGSALPALVLGLAAFLLTACGGGGGGESGTPAADGSRPTASTTPEDVVSGPGTLVVSAAEPVAFDFAPDGRLFFVQRQQGEIRTVNLGAVPPPLASLPPVTAARQHLAAQLNVAIEQLQAASVTAAQWPDACLGAAQPDEVCAQVITPGYTVVLRLADAPGRYTYHTDEGGNVRFVKFDAVSEGPELFATVDTFIGTECGLIGIAVDPEFSTNHYVYVYVTQPVPGRKGVAKPRVIRYTDVDGKGTNPTVIADDLPLTNPKACLHVGGNLHFGPDGYLYLSLGNNERLETSADLSSPLGKILRMNKADGSSAPDNPFANRPGADGRIFAYGLRNPWDFAFHPQTGKIYAPDNGPGNCDELNIIEPGADYGMPDSQPMIETTTCLGLGGVDPIYLFAKPGVPPELFGSNAAPAGVAFLSGTLYPDLGQGLLVCEFNTKALHLLELTGPSQDKVARDVVISDDCVYNVEVGSDGAIYYSDGEGIYRLPPEE